MSHYLHHVVEINKDGKWETFKLLVKPGKYFDYENEENKNKLFKIGDGEQDYYWENEFITSFLSLRDNYFGYNPWEHDKFNCGVPKNASEETLKITEEWVKGNFKMYNCTLEDLEAEANSVFNKWREKTRHEDTMNFAADFARRLGYAKEDGYCNTDPDDTEMLEDMLIMYYQLISLGESIQNMVENVENSYWFDKANIRIIIWTD